MFIIYIIKLTIMNNLKILTYNLWFDTVNIVSRYESLISVVSDTNPDILCFQEVTKDILELLKKHLVEYKFIFPKQLAHSYGCVIMSKFKISKYLDIPFTNSKMGRGLTV